MTATGSPPCENITVSRLDGWLVLDAAVQLQGIAFDRLLEINDSLSGLEKLCLGRDGNLHLRAEIPLEPPANLGENAIPLALASMRSTLKAIRDNTPDHPEPANGETEQKVPNVVAICEEAGFQCVARNEHHWLATLVGTPAYCQAEITLTGSAVCVTVGLPGADSEDERCREASAHLLLAASGAFRMVRAVLPKGSARHSPQMTARFPASETSNYLPHALGSINLAARLTMSELNALKLPAVAGEYLAQARSKDQNPI